MAIPKINGGDRLVMKKAHPCGENVFSVLYAGSDIKLKCEKCGREVIIPRIKAEKMIKSTLEKP